MPHITITSRAQSDLEVCRDFLVTKNPLAAKRAIETIKNRVDLLETTPDLGSPHPLYPGLRQLVIPFGISGYLALYHHDEASNTVLILAFRHQKEAGYSCAIP